MGETLTAAITAENVEAVLVQPACRHATNYKTSAFLNPDDWPRVEKFKNETPNFNIF